MEPKTKMMARVDAFFQDLEDDVFWIGYDDAMFGHPVYYCSTPVTARTLEKFSAAYNEGYAAGLSHTH